MFIAVNSISTKGVNTFFGFITNWQLEGMRPLHELLGHE